MKQVWPQEGRAGRLAVVRLVVVDGEDMDVGPLVVVTEDKDEERLIVVTEDEDEDFDEVEVEEPGRLATLHSPNWDWLEIESI